MDASNTAAEPSTLSADERATVRKLAKALWAVDFAGRSAESSQEARQQSWMTEKRDFARRARKLMRRLEVDGLTIAERG